MDSDNAAAEKIGMTEEQMISLAAVLDNSYVEVRVDHGPFMAEVQGWCITDDRGLVRYADDDGKPAVSISLDVYPTNTLAEAQEWVEATDNFEAGDAPGLLTLSPTCSADVGPLGIAVTDKGQTIHITMLTPRDGISAASGLHRVVERLR